MTCDHRSRWRELVATGVVCAALAGCTSDQPPPTPGAGDSPDAGAAEGADGVATRSDDYPEWQAVDGLQVPRDDFGTAVIGSDVWILGGMTGDRGNRLVSTEILDTRTGRWRTSDIEMPIGLASFETVAVGPRIYAFGGFDKRSRPTASSAVLDTRTGRWQWLPPLPHPRYAHTVTLYRGDIYVIGGRGADGVVAEVDVFDPATESWTTADAPMANARDSHDTVATPDGLMVVGGWLDFGPTDRVDLYDPAADRWSEGPRLPAPVSRAGVAYAEGKVWVSYHELSFVLEEAQEWQQANALPLSRHGLGYVAVGDALYAIGGCALDPLRDVRTVDRLDLA